MSSQTEFPAQGDVPEQSPNTLYDIVAAFDEQNITLLHLSREYIRRPSDERLNHLSQGVIATVDSFTNVVEAIILSQDDTTQQKATILARLLQNEDDRRVGKLAQITKRDIFTPANSDLVERANDIEDVLSATDVTPQDAAKIISVWFEQNLRVDISRLVDHARNRWGFRKIARAVGQHSLRTAEIAAGVTAGVVLAQLIGRKTGRA